MEASAQSERVGIRLKRIRDRLGLSLRQVEERSRKLAEKKQNPDYFISRGWLNNIENGTYTPSACKQYTLGAIYNVHWSRIFPAFGCNISDFGRDQAMFARLLACFRETHLRAKQRDGIRCHSLGVHEHWNNGTDKKYTRNLGKADGDR